MRSCRLQAYKNDVYLFPKEIGESLEKLYFLAHVAVLILHTQQLVQVSLHQSWERSYMCFDAPVDRESNQRSFGFQGGSLGWRLEKSEVRAHHRVHSALPRRAPIKWLFSAEAIHGVFQGARGAGYSTSGLSSRTSQFVAALLRYEDDGQLAVECVFAVTLVVYLASGSHGSCLAA